MGNIQQGSAPDCQMKPTWEEKKTCDQYSWGTKMTNEHRASYESWIWSKFRALTAAVE